MTLDAAFRALADPARRALLDRLNKQNGLSLNELCDGLGMARQSVTKHLAVLEAANLVTTTRRGRQKLHYLNVAPINEIADRWIDTYSRRRIVALADLKLALEDGAVPDTSFVYATYVKTTPQQMWQAITMPTFTLQYWGAALHSDWRVGSPVLWQEGRDGAPKDLGQIVLVSEPFARLSYTWHTYQPEHAALFGWSDDEFARLVTEPRSTVSFEIAPASDGVVKLTVIHDGFDVGSPMLEAVRGDLPPSRGWPGVFAGLKTLLEAGEPLF